jgi:dTDP-4-amino-4,6-dideoxygalactose transaminase
MSNFGTSNRLTLRHGTNSKLSEYQAAVALAQLDRWEKIKIRRRQVFDLYIRELAYKNLTEGLQKDITRAITSCLMLNIGNGQAAEMVDDLNVRGVNVHRCYWPPLSHHPYFTEISKADNLPNAESLNRSVIGLPFHTFMNKTEVASVVRQVADYPNV